MLSPEQTVVALAGKYAAAVRDHRKKNTLTSRRALFDAEIELLQCAQNLNSKGRAKTRATARR